MINEIEMVSQVLAGDRRAFSLLIVNYKRLVYSVVFRLIDQKEDTEDVCQEVFIKVYNSLSRFEFQSKLSTWIARIAYMTVITHVRKHKLKRHCRLEDDLDNFHFTEETPEQLMQIKEQTLYIQKLVAELPEKYKTVITLFHLQEFSLLEIAEISGMPEGTVKNYLFRARQLLKDKLAIYLKQDNDGKIR
jgi:RNA polymerase sigma factor (sigma-70 family)